MFAWCIFSHIANIPIYYNYNHDWSILDAICLIGMTKSTAFTSRCKPDTSLLIISTAPRHLHKSITTNLFPLLLLEHDNTSKDMIREATPILCSLKTAQTSLYFSHRSSQTGGKEEDDDDDGHVEATAIGDVVPKTRVVRSDMEWPGAWSGAQRRGRAGAWARDFDPRAQGRCRGGRPASGSTGEEEKAVAPLVGGLLSVR